jgi:hypothetical protein
MSNSLLTVNQITRKALMTLHSKLSFISNCNKQYDSSFGQTGAKIGDTLRVRLPNEYTVRTNMTLAAQNTVEQKVDLPVTSIAGVDVSFTSQELALSLDDFNDRILDPAMAVIAANIESTFFTNMYRAVPNIVDNDTAAFTFGSLSSARQILTENLAPPSKRTVVLTPTHATRYMNDTKGLFHSAGNISEQYKEGVIGKTQGFDIYENTLLGSHTTGTAAKTTGYVCNTSTGITSGNPVVTVSGGTTTFLVGDIVTIADVFAVHPETKQSLGYLKQFVVTANSGANAVSLSLSPAPVTSGARQNVALVSAGASKAITKVGAGASEQLTNSLAFYRDAFTFATADLPLPEGVHFAGRQVLDGISMSIVRDFSISDRSFPCRIDVLWGGAALRPQLACRIHADG